MALQRINLGTAGNDGSGDAIRTAFQKVNDNFAELYGTSGEANSVKDDASPQLGGDLDVNGRSIVSIGNNNINIFPHGSGEVNIDQVRFLNSSITPNITNANLALAGNGTGYISLSGLKWPTVDGANGQVLQTNGAGTLSWVNNAGGGGGSTGDLSIVGSTIMAPSNADMVLTNSGTGSIVIDTISINQNEITANSSNANLELSGNGTGSVTINNLKFPTSDGTAGQVLKTDGSGNLSFIDGGTQNLFATITSDSGSTTANTTTDTLTVAGGTNITTAISGDTLTITGPTLTGYAQKTDTGLNVVGDDSSGTAFKIGESIKVAGGAGITTAVSGDVLTITASASAPDQFKTVTGNVGSTTANSATDTLTIVGASGTGLKTSISSDTLTITPDPITIVGDDSSGTAVNLGEAFQIAGGTGITTAVAGDVLTITAAQQNLFQTIAVAGQTSVAADTATDTLTLVAGTNVSITTNAGSDAITINATGTSTGIRVAGDDSSSTLIGDGETVKIAGTQNVTTAMSGDVLTITGPNLSSYVTASSSATFTNKAGNISQWTNNSGYITNSPITVVGDDSSGTVFNTGETIKIAGGTNITTAVSGDTLTITGATTATSLSTDGMTINDNNITATRSNDNINITPSGTGVVVAGTQLRTPILTTNSIKSDDSTAVTINDALNVSGTITATTIQADSINAPTSLTGTYSITSPTTITLDPTSEIINDAPMKLVSKTVAQLGSLVASAGAIAYCSNESGGAQPCFYDGSNWRRFTDRAIVS